MQTLNTLFWWLYSIGGASSNSNDPLQEEAPVQNAEKPSFKKFTPSLSKTEKEEINEHNQNHSRFIERSLDGKTRIETFDSIRVFVGTIESRRDNNISHKGSEITGRKDFTGTDSYPEAKQLLYQGYSEILPEVKSLVENEVVKYKKEVREAKRPLVCVEGYVPIVPRAIIGLPDSMWQTKKERKEIKCCHIIYMETASFDTNKDRIIQAGVKLLATLQILALNKIQTRLDIVCYAGRTLEECHIGCVRVKEYQESLNLLKLCFPLAHPSFLRRFGFKFLETIPEKLDFSFARGYGRPLSHSVGKHLFNPEKRKVFLSFDKIEELDTVKQIIDYINNELSV